MFIIIKDDRFPNSSEIIQAPEGTDPEKVFALWQEKSIHYLATGERPSGTVSTSKADDLIGAIIEGGQ